MADHEADKKSSGKLGALLLLALFIFAGYHFFIRMPRQNAEIDRNVRDKLLNICLKSVNKTFDELENKGYKTDSYDYWKLREECYRDDERLRVSQ